MEKKSGDFKSQILIFNLYLQKPKSQKFTQLLPEEKCSSLGGSKGNREKQKSYIGSYKTDEFTLLHHSTEMVQKLRLLAIIASVTQYKKNETRPSIYDHFSNHKCMD